MIIIIIIYKFFFLYIYIYFYSFKVVKYIKTYFHIKSRKEGIRKINHKYMQKKNKVFK